MAYSTRCMTDSDWSAIKHFKPNEFKDPSKMGFEFMLWLDKLRERANVPMRISSSYRSPEYNRQVGGAKDSAHTDVPCNAVDIDDIETSATDPNWNYARFRIVKTALDLGCERIGTYRNGSLHLDRSESKRPSPRMWITF
jgi:uncharacterized protein YcbK (DUF882 family)